MENDKMQASTRELMTRVLREYVSCGVIGIACDRAGVRRKTHRDWLKDHPKYAELFEELHERFVDGLEVVAIERGKEKSDSLLMFMLKAERREKFGDRADVNLAGQAGKPPVQLVFAEGMLNEEEKLLLGATIQAPVEKEESVDDVDLSFEEVSAHEEDGESIEGVTSYTVKERPVVVSEET